MGVKEVHHPDALHCITGFTFCPWCGKEGQNKGTVVNDLWTMHYKLGLVCNWCLHFPSITSEAIQHHSWGCKQPREVTSKRKMGGLMMCPCPTYWPQLSHLAWHYPPRWGQCKCFKIIMLQDTHTFSTIHTFFTVIVITHCRHTYFCNKDDFKAVNSHLCWLPCAT